MYTGGKKILLDAVSCFVKAVLLRVIYPVGRFKHPLWSGQLGQNVTSLHCSMTSVPLVRCTVTGTTVLAATKVNL